MRVGSEGPRLGNEKGEVAACNLSICLGGRTGNGLKAPGRGSPWGVCGQTSF